MMSWTGKRLQLIVLAMFDEVNEGTAMFQDAARRGRRSRDGDTSRIFVRHARRRGLYGAGRLVPELGRSRDSGDAFRHATLAQLTAAVAVRLMRGKAFLASFVLMFCATSVQAQEPVSPLTVSETSVTRFIPTVPSGDVRKGMCWTESIAVSRSGAWRCMVGNGIR